MSEVAVETVDLVKTFGAFTAVDHVSLQVAKGEIFGFLGPNGAGKTTTIRVLCGVFSPSSRRGAGNGVDVGRQAEEGERRIGEKSQKFSLLEDFAGRGKNE